MKYLPMFFLYGIMFGVGPCFASCGPLLISYFGSNVKTASQNLPAYLAFSLARVAVYVFLGILVFALGSFWAQKHLESIFPFILILGGIVTIIIGIASLLGKIKSRPGFCSFKGNAACLGLLVGLMPCAPLIAVLSYMGLVAQSWKMSLLYSLAFGLGSIISPLGLLVLFTGFFPKILKTLCSLVLIGMGIHLIIKGL